MLTLIQSPYTLIILCVCLRMCDALCIVFCFSCVYLNNQETCLMYCCHLMFWMLINSSGWRFNHNKKITWNNKQSRLIYISCLCFSKLFILSILPRTNSQTYRLKCQQTHFRLEWFLFLSMFIWMKSSVRNRIYTGDDFTRQRHFVIRFYLFCHLVSSFDVW